MAATARIARTLLPQPTEVSREEVQLGYGGQINAIDAIYDAYMALNAADGVFAQEYGSKANPMALVAKAGKAALALLDGVSAAQAAKIWDYMVNNGSGARWNYDLWRNGQI